MAARRGRPQAQGLEVADCQNARAVQSQKEGLGGENTEALDVMVDVRVIAGSDYPDSALGLYLDGDRVQTVQNAGSWPQGEHNIWLTFFDPLTDVPAGTYTVGVAVSEAPSTAPANPETTCGRITVPDGQNGDNGGNGGDGTNGGTQPPTNGQDEGLLGLGIGIEEAALLGGAVALGWIVLRGMGDRGTPSRARRRRRPARGRGRQGQTQRGQTGQRGSSR